MGQTIRPTDKVTISSEAISCDLMHEMAVLNIKSGVYFGLEGVGCATWQFIQEPRTVAEILEHLLERYDVDPETCAAQTAAFIRDLMRHGLVVVDETIRA